MGRRRAEGCGYPFAQAPAAGLHGRRKAHRLGPRRQHLLNELYPRLALHPALGAPAEARTLFAPPVDEVWLEIGFGGGEHLVHQAEAHPHAGLIGCEPFENGMARALAAIEVRNLANVRVYQGDARDILRCLPTASLNRVFLLYPDPWPKRRHLKRRFVSAGALDAIARVLEPGGVLRFASDIDSYVEWTLQHIAAHAAFADRTADAAAPWPDWRRTRYETKAVAEGRTPAYLTFERLP